jgi:predicted secreted protein
MGNTLTLSNRTPEDPTMTTRLLTCLLMPLALSLSAGAAAQSVYPPPSNVLSLSASASTEVPRDMLGVTMWATREGSDATTVQAQLKQALDAALNEARKAARPGQLEVRTGGFSLMPRYVKGVINGWQGTAELILEGRDIPAISQLAGRLPTMTVARVGFSLSREAREQVETEVAAQAIARYRAHADVYAKQFGFGGWTLREVQVNTQGDPGGPVPMMRAQMAPAMAADSPLPVEAGKASVTVTVNGSVQLSIK